MQTKMSIYRKVLKENINHIQQGIPCFLEHETVFAIEYFLFAYRCSTNFLRAFNWFPKDNPSNGTL